MSALVTDRLITALGLLGASLRRDYSFGPNLLFCLDIDGTMDTWASHSRFIRELRRSAYCRSLNGNIAPAMAEFDEMNVRDLGSWSNIFRSISMFIETQHQLEVLPNEIRVCADLLVPEVMSRYPIEARPGLGDFIPDFLRVFPGPKAALSIVTNSSFASLTAKLELLGVADYFPEIDYDDGEQADEALKPNAEAFFRMESAVFGSRERATILVCEDSVPNVIDLLRKSNNAKALLFPRTETAEDLFERINDPPKNDEDYILHEAMVGRRLAVAEDWEMVRQHVLA